MFTEIKDAFRKTYRLLEKSEQARLWLTTLLMILGGFLTNIPALVLGRLVDEMFSEELVQFSATLPFILLIIASIIGREFLVLLNKYNIENLKTLTYRKQTVAAINHLLRTDIHEFFSNYQIGALHGRIFRAIEGLISLIGLTFLDFLPLFFTAIAALILGLIQAPPLAALMALFVPTSFYIIIKQIRSQRGIRINLLRGKERIDGKVVEMLGGIATIRTDNTVNFEVKKVEKISEELRRTEMKHHVAMMLFDAVKSINEGVFYVLVVSASIYLALIDVITIGEILTYALLFMSVIRPLRELHRILDHIHESTIRVNDLYTFLSQPVDKSFLVQQSTKISTKHDQIPVLEMKHLSYTYAEKKEDTLRNISLSLYLGERIGIVGSSGSGKSTLVKIILKLLHNYDGDIKLFEKNLNTVTREEIAAKIAYVPQMPYVFSGSVRDNVKYGTQEATDQDVINALQKANLFEEVICDFGGLNGTITENGTNLSGGQRQRLALARIFLKDPEILILDEATSALDNTNEYIVHKNLKEIFYGKAMLIIAHRLTTLKDTDRIIVFDKGSVVQNDTYLNLSQDSGLFRNFMKQVD